LLLWNIDVDFLQLSSSHFGCSFDEEDSRCGQLPAFSSVFHSQIIIYNFRPYWNLSVIARSFTFLSIRVWTLVWTGFYWLISSPKCISINSHFHRWRGQPVNPAPITSINQVLHIYGRLCSEISAKSASNLQATQRNLRTETQESDGDGPFRRSGCLTPLVHLHVSQKRKNTKSRSWIPCSSKTPTRKKKNILHVFWVKYFICFFIGIILPAALWPWGWLNL